MGWARIAVSFILMQVTMGAVGEVVVAPLQRADWKTMSSKTECRMWQVIENFGTAGFLQEAGEPLLFYLQDDEPRPEIDRASLFVEPAPWRDNVVYRRDYRVFYDSDKRPNRLFVVNDVAEIMQDSLLQGYTPVFSFFHRGAETRVEVFPVHFREADADFLACRSALLPFSKNQLEREFLFYMPLVLVLPSGEEKRLRKVGVFLREVGNVQAVVVSATALAGKSTDRGFQERAKRIVDALIQLGVNKKQISIRTHAYGQSGENELRLRIFAPDALRVYYFRNGSTALSATDKNRLQLLAHYLNEFYSGNLLIKSHTDSKGSKSANLAISQARGDKIKSYLVKQGVSPERLTIKAYGESKPVKSNRFSSGRAANRRVVISFLD